MTETALPGERDEGQFALRACTARVADRVAATFDDRGAFGEPTLSRVPESALMLALLRRQRLYPHVQKRLEHFIATCRTDPHLHPVEQVLAKAALGLPQPPHAVDRALDGLPAHAEGRKQLLFALYLAVLGQGSYRPRAARLDYRGQTSWGELTGCAMKILSAHGLGQQVARPSWTASGLPARTGRSPPRPLPSPRSPCGLRPDRPG